MTRARSSRPKGWASSWCGTPGLLLEYFDAPAATREAWDDEGYFRTGDLAQLRQDGNLGLVGSKREMFKSGGYNVYPKEIELVLEEHPAVAMAAVAPAPDPLYDEVGVAHLELADPGATPDQLRTRCRERLADYKVRAPSTRRRPILIGSVVAAVVLLGGGLAWKELSESTNQVLVVGPAARGATGRVTVSIQFSGGPAPGTKESVPGKVVFINTRTGKWTSFKVPAGESSHILAAGRYRSFATSPSYQGGRLRCLPVHAVISIPGPGARTEVLHYWCSIQ